MNRKHLPGALGMLGVAATCLAVAGAMPHQRGPGGGFGPEPGKNADGPPPAGFGPGGGFGPGLFLAPVILDLADANNDGKLTPDEAARAAESLVRRADTGKTGSVDAAALGQALNRRLGPPPGFGPDGGGDLPDDFGPGTMVAGQILDAADANNDGKLTPAEAASAARKFVTDSDTNRTGTLDGHALAAVINRQIGPPPGFGPGGPMGGADRPVVAKFDRDGNGRLDLAERKTARAEIAKDGARGGFGPPGGGRGGLGGRGGFGPPGGGPPGFGQREPGKPGPKVDPSQVTTYPDRPLYDPSTMRTLFFTFESDDWEAELADFRGTDVEVPATLLVDGQTFKDVGIHFRGNTSYMMVPAGSKRSLNVSLDFVHEAQRLDGYKTLNLLNSHEDPSFLHAVLYLDLARRHLPAPQANLVRVVINGESWGVYANVQQFDKIFATQHFPDGKNARWKVPGHPGATSGLSYLGDDIEEYRRRYEIKSNDDPKDWNALVTLCRTLSETPIDQLEESLRPMLDIDSALWFLAIDNALVNADGYWTRASDYSLLKDRKGVFHVLPGDVNETFSSGGFGPPGGGRGGFGRGGPGGPQGKGQGRGGFGPPGGPPPAGPGGPGGFGPPGGGPGGGGVNLDPLVGLDNPNAPLRSRLLQVPSLRAKYLANVREIAQNDLDWKTLGPIVAQYRELIDAEVAADTRKLSSLEAFRAAVADTPAPAAEAKAEANANAPRGRRAMSLRAFADGRRSFLLNHAEVKKAVAAVNAAR